MSDAADGPLLTVLMPVYNEAPTLLEAIRRVAASPVDKEIVIVDDASTDGTREILRSEVEGAEGVRVVYCDRNGGKGMAIRAGVPHCRGRYVVIQDGDLEYDPNDYAVLLERATAGGATVVYGSRFLMGPPPMRLPNRLINWLLAAMVRRLFGAPITDEATCYKLFRRDVLQAAPLTCRRFEFCPEVTAKVIRMGHRIAEVPISYTPRSVQQGKKIRWHDGVVAVWTLLKFRWWNP